MVFKNKGCFLWLAVTAVGGASCVCVCACEKQGIGHLPVKVLNFTNDLTMPPGTGLAPLATLFVCLFLYLESAQTGILLEVRFL